MPSCEKHKIIYNFTCSECQHEFVKSQNEYIRAEEKRLKDRQKALKKALEPRELPNKVSAKQKVRNREYAKVREQFLLGKWCAYHGHGCIPTDIHHAAGRTGDLLTDTRYFVAVCREAHDMIEMRPLWAKANGFSVSRLGNKPHSKRKTVDGARVD